MPVYEWLSKSSVHLCLCQVCSGGYSSASFKQSVRLAVPQATTFAGIAQLVEHLICNQEVRGSSPCVGTNKIKHLQAFWNFRIFASFFKAYREAYGWSR